MADAALAAAAWTEDEKLSEREVLAEQVRLVHGMASRSAWSMALLSIFVAAILHNLGPVILVWLAAQLTLKLAAHIELRYFFSDASIANDPEHMVRRLMLGQSPHAAIWSSVVGLTAVYGTPAELIFSIMVAIGMIGGSATTYGPLLRIYATYLATFIVTQIVFYVLFNKAAVHNGYFQYAPILTIIFCVAIYPHARLVSRTHRQFIQLGFTNARLARRLEREVASTRQAQRDAEAANAAKSTFLASASHDLRQPLHALGMFLALLERSKLNSDQRATLGMAKSAMMASSEMLDVLLDFSRAEAGAIVPRVQPFKLGQVLREIEDEIAVAADEKRIFYRTFDGDVTVESDPALVKMILQNLVTNAIRYTDRGGVLLGWRRRDDQVVVEVWDTGRGIPQDQREAIFSDFIQLGNPERDRRKGLGLGLAIARRLARLIGSDVTLGSQVGRGSVFRFSLPLSAREPAEVRTDTAGIGRSPEAPSLELRPTGHVLILDDDEAIRLALGALLRDSGYTVDVAETLDEAQEQVQRRAPDLLICDYRLRAGENGAEAVRLLRAALGRRVPALLITGDTHPDRIAEAAREDMEILYKPTQPVPLLNTISRLLAQEAPAAPVTSQY